MSSPQPLLSPQQLTSATQECFNLLADCLIERREAITQLWIDGVRSHPGIPSSRSLTFQQLSDHLPKLFDDLTAALRTAGRAAGESEHVVREILHDARQHGYHRWIQDFQLDELVRELSIIRSLVMINGIEWFLELHPVCGPEVNAARSVIVRFFEEVSIGSVEQYIDAQQAQLESLNQELSRIDSSRLQLMRTVAHELGNSVYSLKMIMAALSSSGPQSEADIQRALRLSEGAFTEIQLFLNQLTDYSTLLSQPVTEWENVHLPSFCAEIDETFRPAATAAGLRFTAVCENGLETVRSDRHKLKRIVSNLLTNAIKFRQPDRADGAVSLHLVPVDAAAWKLIAEDTGIGIAPADRERVFEEFVRLPSAIEVPGSGLGLAITRRLTGLLGGQIAVEGLAGGGSRFVVEFPREQQTA